MKINDDFNVVNDHVSSMLLQEKTCIFTDKEFNNEIKRIDNDLKSETYWKFSLLPETIKAFKKCTKLFI